MATTPQQIPLNISIAPFPEGFQGDMDETFQQACQLMEATIAGNFLTGLILPPGSTLPSTDQGPIAIGNVWYFFDPVSGQYLPQTVSSKIARNFVKNPVYQVQQTGSAFTLSGTGPTKTYDLVQPRTSVANVLAIAADVGPPASGDNDYCPAAIKYTVGPTLVPTPAATDLLTHEHLIEGTDIAMIQGQTLSLSFSVWTNTPGTYSYYITSTGRDASYVGPFTITTANAWTRIKQVGIPALPTGVGTWNFGEGSTGIYIGIPMCVGTQWQSAAGNLNKWQPAFMAGAASNTNLCTVVNNQIKISGIKLEASPQVSYLSVPSFEQDYWECIRYYFTTFAYQSASNGFPVLLTAPLNGKYSVQFGFPRRMAKVPMVVPFGYNSHVSGQITDMSVATPVDIPVASLAAIQKGISDSQNAVISTTGTIAVPASVSGIVALNSTQVIGMASTAGLSIGMPVSGTNIAPNTVIDSIGTGTTVSLAGTTAVNSTAVTGITSTAALSAGMSVSGSGIAPGTVIDVITSSTAILLSKVAAGAGSFTLSFQTFSITISKPATGAGTVTLSFGTFSITAIPSTSGMRVGQAISGTGIPSGAVINTIVSGTAIAISQAITTSGTGVTLSISQTIQGETLWAMINADARLG